MGFKFPIYLQTLKDEIKEMHGLRISTYHELIHSDKTWCFTLLLTMVYTYSYGQNF